jgi:hypothetical protein
MTNGEFAVVGNFSDRSGVFTSGGNTDTVAPSEWGMSLIMAKSMSTCSAAVLLRNILIVLSELSKSAKMLCQRKVHFIRNDLSLTIAQIPDSALVEVEVD